MSAIFDLRTDEGIAAAQADLDAFKARIETCVTRDLLPWGLGIGRRQMLINQARAAPTATPADAVEGDTK